MSASSPSFVPVILLAFANERTNDGFLRHLTRELKLILNALEPAIQKGRCHVKILPAASQEEIIKVFQDEWYAGRIWIFHYGGHADEDELWLTNEAGGNQAFFSYGLATFLGAQSSLRLVFLNGCATEDHAQLLLEANIPATITTSRAINDSLAQRFATIFYQGLAGGASIEESFTEAEGAVLGELGTAAFQVGAGMRSLYWDEPATEALDVPWRLSYRAKEQWVPAQWRLFYTLGAATPEPSSDDEQLIGQTVGGNLELIEVLGCGSTGTVFRAKHLALNEERAVKITHPVLEGYEALRQVVLAGYQGLNAIRHPNVVRFYDAGEVILVGEKRLYIVMEIVPGKRLDEMDYEVYRDGKTGLERLEDIFVQIATGLEAAHKTTYSDINGSVREGIVHGNIKPRKILFTHDGTPKLIDFIFTDLTRSANIKLSIPKSVQTLKQGESPEEYLAPEVIEGLQGVDKLTDIFALGAVFFEVMTSKSLADFSFSSAEELHKFVKNDQRLFPKSLSRAVYFAIRPDRLQRTQEVSTLIGQLLEHVTIWKRLTYWLRRKK